MLILDILSFDCSSKVTLTLNFLISFWGDFFSKVVESPLEPHWKLVYLILELLCENKIGITKMVACLIGYLDIFLLII